MWIVLGHPENYISHSSLHNQWTDAKTKQTLILYRCTIYWVLSVLCGIHLQITNNTSPDLSHDPLFLISLPGFLITLVKIHITVVLILRCLSLSVGGDMVVPQSHYLRVPGFLVQSWPEVAACLDVLCVSALVSYIFFPTSKNILLSKLTFIITAADL